MSKINFMNREQTERCIAQMLDRYFKNKNNGMIKSSIDIDDFVLNFLECQIIYESIGRSSNTLGYVSDGVNKLKVFRKGRVRDVLFPKDTIVLDKYLCSSNMESKRRFVLGHEAGHIIENRIYHLDRSYFNREFDVNGDNSIAVLREQFSPFEFQADHISACLLMPKELVMKHLEVAFHSYKVVRYEDGSISQYDRVMLDQIADEMKVSKTSFMRRLEELDLFEIRPLPYSCRNEVIVYE